MKKRVLGNTGIMLSEVGYGAAALFGKNILGKEGISEEKANQIITTAIQRGVNFFDTGFNYGYAEERLGRCISSIINGGGSTNRSKLIIESKCGETLNSDGSYGRYNWSSDWLKKSLEISLKRLNTDYLDLYAMHGECGYSQLDKVIKTFNDMKSEGLIRAYGVNTFNDSFLEFVAKEGCFDYVMLDYNILRQEREPIISKLYNKGIGVIAGSALGESLYSKKFKITNRNDLWYWARSVVRFKELKKKSKNFVFLTKNEKYTANQLALKYVLDNSCISSAVFSTTSINHLEENLAAVNITIPDDMKKEINRNR